VVGFHPSLRGQRLFYPCVDSVSFIVAWTTFHLSPPG
jgi:hypothetical protein